MLWINGLAFVLTCAGSEEASGVSREQVEKGTELRRKKEIIHRNGGGR